MRREPEGSERDVEAMFLDHLESRRGELAVAMWQAPALTIAAQAFLLIVITDDDISAVARGAVLIAGIFASLAAILALLRLREREVRYSEAIAFHGKNIHMQDPRPHALIESERKPLPQEGRIDKWLRRLASKGWFPAIHLAWAIALVSFIVADIVAFCATT